MRDCYVITSIAANICLLIAGPSEVRASPPPSPLPRAPEDRRPTTAVPLKEEGHVTWRLHRNFATESTTRDEKGYRKVRALDVTQLDQSQRRTHKPGSPYAVWTKETQELDQSGEKGFDSVVDEKIFTDCRMVEGRFAVTLDHDGLLIGRLRAKEYDALDVVEFLVSSGIVNANAHMIATVECIHFSSEAGHWFRLHSTDPYRTNTANVDKFNFGIHIATDGTIRMINVDDVGQMLAVPSE